jgi:hypothetical protein
MGMQARLKPLEFLRQFLQCPVGDFLANNFAGGRYAKNQIAALPIGKRTKRAASFFFLGGGFFELQSGGFATGHIYHQSRGQGSFMGMLCFFGGHLKELALCAMRYSSKK